MLNYFFYKAKVLCFFQKNQFNIDSLSNIFKLQPNTIGQILNNITLISFLDKFKSNPKKWIRLRKTIEENASKELRETTTLTIKHILKNDEYGIQQMNEHEIDIDTWPRLPTYFEVEGKDKNDLEKILNLLGYSFEDAVSCTVDEIYQTIGMDINNMKELKF